MDAPASNSLPVTMLRQRLITAFLLGAAFFAALYNLSDFGWALFLLLFIVVGAWEWAGLSGFDSAGRVTFSCATALAGGLLLPDISEFELIRQWSTILLMLSAAVFWVLVAPFWLVKRWHVRHWLLAVLMGWLLLFPAWIALVDLRHIGPGVILVVMLTIALADSAAYFSGKKFGKRKLAPEISPGKTWEGLFGALIAVFVYAVGLCAWLGWSLWFVVGFLALVILSVMGDLFESLIKRHAGKKDSGSILPGHGGVLDRIDGLTSTLPLVAFYAYLPYYLSVLFAR